MDETEDQLSEIGEDEDEENKDNVISSQNSRTQPNQTKPLKMPSLRFMRKLMKDQHSYERKKLIFLSFNSVTLAITIFNLLSSVNIEGQESLINYDETARVQIKEQSIYYLIFCLIIVHLIKIFSCVVGYFAVHQKSEKIIILYMILSAATLILRGVITLLLIISYNVIKDICIQIFGEDNDIGRDMAIQYIIVLSIFVVIEILLSLVSIVQSSQSKDEYVEFKKYYDRLLKNQVACYEIALHIYS